MATKLHLSFLICALPAIFQLVASHESTSPSAALVHYATSVAARIIQFFAKPNYLALLLSWLSLSGDAVE